MVRPQIVKHDKIKELKQMGNLTNKQIADKLGISERTVYRAFQPDTSDTSPKVSNEDILTLVKDLTDRIPATKKARRSVETRLMTKSRDMLQELHNYFLTL